MFCLSAFARSLFLVETYNRIFTVFFGFVFIINSILLRVLARKWITVYSTYVPTLEVHNLALCVPLSTRKVERGTERPNI